MSCKNLQSPQPPTLEQMPPGIKPPKGSTLDTLKNLASGNGLSNAMSNAGDLVGNNLKNLGSSLSPSALAGKIGQAVEGVVDTIASRVTAAIDGVSNLKDRLKSFDPNATLEKTPGSPDSIKSNLKAKLTGFGEFSNLQSTISNNKCDEQYIKQAGQMNKNITNDAASAVKNISNKDRRKMASDPEFKKIKQQQIQEQVKNDTAKKATQTASTEDVNIKTTQETLQSNIIETVKSNTDDCYKFINKWLPSAVQHTYNVYYYKHQSIGRSSDFAKFHFQGINSNNITNAYETIKSVGHEYVDLLKCKYWFQTVWNDSICGKTIKNDQVSAETDIEGSTSQTLDDILSERYIWGDKSNHETVSMPTYKNNIPITHASIHTTFFKQFTSTKPAIRDLTTSGVIDTMWYSQISDYKDAVNNFKEVISTSKDEIVKNNHDWKQDALANAITLGNEQLIDSLELLIDDESNFVTYWGSAASPTDTVGLVIYFDWSTASVMTVKHLPGTLGDYLDW